MNDRNEIQRDGNRKRPSACPNTLIIVGLLLLAGWQWQANRSLQQENEQLRQTGSASDRVELSSVALRTETGWPIRSPNAQAQKIKSLWAEIQQLRELTNELHVASMEALRAGMERARIAQEKNLDLQDELVAKPRVPRIGAWLGVGILNSTGQQGGVAIGGVVDRGPADQANVERGDVILSIDGHPVGNTDEFKSILAKKDGSQAVVLEVARKTGVSNVLVKPWN